MSSSFSSSITLALSFYSCSVGMDDSSRFEFLVVF